MIGEGSVATNGKARGSGGPPGFSAWLRRNRFALAGYAILVLPALIVPAFVHEQSAMKGWVYFAWIFACPLGALVGNLGKKRTLVYALGIGSFMVPICLVWYFAFAYTFVSPPASLHLTPFQAEDWKQQLAASRYLPVIILASCILWPLGFALTYMGTRDQRKSA